MIRSFALFGLALPLWVFTVAFAQLRGDAVMRDGLLRAHGQIWGEWYHFPPESRAVRK